jgi:hypothetical protein
LQGRFRGTGYAMLALQCLSTGSTYAALKGRSSTVGERF